jgi:hypothetical protein
LEIVLSCHEIKGRTKKDVPAKKRERASNAAGFQIPDHVRRDTASELAEKRTQ